jgi:hypothetical protein
MAHGMNDPLQQTTCSGGAVDSPYLSSKRCKNKDFMCRKSAGKVLVTA